MATKAKTGRPSEYLPKGTADISSLLAADGSICMDTIAEFCGF